MRIQGDTMRLKVENCPPATRAADIFLAITETELENSVNAWPRQRPAVAAHPEWSGA